MRNSRRSAVDPFIVMDVMHAAAQAEAEGRHIIHMEVGQPGTPAPALARAAVAAAIEAGPLGYTVALGLPALRAGIARLYRRWCTAGPRAELASTLVAADATTAIVRTGPIEPVRAAADPPPARKPVRPKTHRVERGETLNRIAERYDCNLRELARANKLRAPRYLVRPGQHIKLAGCGR